MSETDETTPTDEEPPKGPAYKDTCSPVDGNQCLPYSTPNITDYDQARIVPPFEGVSQEGCNADMVASDLDGDGILSRDEYKVFVSKTAERRCLLWPDLTLGQKGIFVSLACYCATLGEPASCCFGKSANLPTSGAANARTATEPETVFLENVCFVTYGTLPPTNCSYTLLPFNPPPPPVVDPRGGGQEVGSYWNLVAPIIATILLCLLCCCCCCILRRRRRKEEQEEELIETEYPGKEEWLETPLPEQVSRSMPLPMEEPPPPMPEPEEVPMDEPEEFEEEGGSRGGGHSDDESSDGEGRRFRGGNHAIPEEEDTKRKWPGGEYIPPEKDDENVKLKPIPPKEPEPPEPWDEPGRDIEEIVPDKEEDSVQEFEPYVPDSGVNIPERPEKSPVTWKNDWERGERPEPDENDGRKHRIQTGMGQGEIWDRLDHDSASKSTVRQTGDVFDWVVKSALEVMDGADQQGFLEGDDESTVQTTPQN